MPYSRPTLSDLRTQVAQQIAAALPGSDPLLRTSVLKILGDITAGAAHLQYGYLDWIAQQSNPFTASDEYLEAWAALKSVTRLASTPATGTATFTGTNGTVVPSGTVFVRGDGWRYTTTAPATVAGGVVTVSAQADAGSTGNADNGTLVNMFSAIVGINSAGVATSAFTGGADVEDDDSLRARMLLAYQQPARGGSKADYIRWAREVAGVTRAWCLPHADGAGTVAMYVMLDVAQAVHDGFPQGVSGAAAGQAASSAAAMASSLPSSARAGRASWANSSDSASKACSPDTIPSAASPARATYSLAIEPLAPARLSIRVARFGSAIPAASSRWFPALSRLLKASIAAISLPVAELLEPSMTKMTSSMKNHPRPTRRARVTSFPGWSRLLRPSSRRGLFRAVGIS